MLGIRKRIVIQETVNRRQQLAQLNRHSKYCHDTMVLYQLELVDHLLKNRWHISSQMTKLQREETQTSTSLMAFTRLREKHLSILDVDFSYC